MESGADVLSQLVLLDGVYIELPADRMLLTTVLRL